VTDHLFSLIAFGEFFLIRVGEIISVPPKLFCVTF